MNHLIGIETEILDGKEYLCHVFTVAENRKEHFVKMDSFCNDDIFARRLFNAKKQIKRQIVCSDALSIYDIVEKMRDLGLADYDYQYYAKMVECGLCISYSPYNSSGDIIVDCDAAK